VLLACFLDQGRHVQPVESVARPEVALGLWECVYIDV
jgi:hypothetical protein